MSPAQSEKKGTKRPPNEAIAHSKNRQKIEKEKSKTKGVYLTPTEKYKSICQGIYIGTFDTEEAAANAFNLALGKTKEQLKQEMALKFPSKKELRVASEAAKSLERERKKKLERERKKKLAAAKKELRVASEAAKSLERERKKELRVASEAAKSLDRERKKKIAAAKKELRESLERERQKEEKEQAIREKVASGQRVTVSPGVVHISGKFTASILGLHIGTFDTAEAAKDAIKCASGKEIEQLKKELQEKKEQEIQEKVAAGQRVTVSRGVVHISGKFTASILGLDIGTFDTKEAAIDEIKLATGKEKELHKIAAAKKELRVAAAAAKQEQRVATGYVGVAERKMKITNTTCDQRLASSQTVGPEGQTKIVEVITTILSDDFEVPSEGSTIISKALNIILQAMKGGLKKYPETYKKEIVMWNCISNYCINSHIALLIALLMASRNHSYTSELWAASHKEVLYALSNGLDVLKTSSRKRICDDNEITHGRPLIVGSPIVEIGGAGSGKWKRKFERDTDYYKRLQVKITGQQFTGGGASAAKGILGKTLSAAIPLLWSSANITTQDMQELGKQLMAHLGIIDHDVMGKLVEMEHWHNMKYYGHRPVGIYWFHKNGQSLDSLNTTAMKKTALVGFKWIVENSRR